MSESESERTEGSAAESRGLPDEELEAQDGEELPDREAMTIVDLGPDVGLTPIPLSEAPDDRYEQ